MAGWFQFAGGVAGPAGGGGHGGRRGMRPVVERRFIGQLAVGDLGHNVTVMADAQPAIAGDLTDLDGLQSPFAEHLVNFLLAAARGHQQHALLRFGEHDLVRGHAGFALRHLVELDFDADLAAAAHLASRAGEAGGAHVLNADDGAGLHGLDAGLEQQLLHERIADLHVGTLLLGFLGEFGAGDGGAVYAVAAGARAHVDDRVADARGLGIEDVFLAADAEREHVHQRVAVIARFEDALAAHGGHAEAVAVMGDAGNHAGEDAPVAGAGFGIVQTAEAERIEHRDRPRAHGENVAQNAARAGGGALKGFDEAGVVVRFDFESDDVAAADIDDAGVFARPLHH